ncbi:MAG TPA: DUF1259 domain-containing protein, partial [Gemmatimonadaceae bacterium]|nr:DUF1259 domain-containing protein [Gemmatimonadaceae bacterium]
TQHEEIGAPMYVSFRLMDRRTRRLIPTMMITSLAAFSVATAQRAAAPEWSAVEQALGRRGTSQPGGVMRFGFPRGDLTVTIGDLKLLPAFALGGWVAFRPEGSSATMMGDLVLKEGELNGVIDRLRQGGVGVTAVHNHLLGETPHVLYAHVHGHGDPVRLAETVHAALATTQTPLGQPPAVMAVRIELDTTAISQILGTSGRVNGGVYQVSVPRAGAIREGGKPLPPAMGVATAINFQPTGGNKAAVTGDFVMTAPEVAPVQAALRANHIAITALHSHMIDEEPHLFFMHFWAVDDAPTLARGLRAALDHMATKRP